MFTRFGNKPLMPEQNHLPDAEIGRRRSLRHQICAPGSYRTGSGTARRVDLTDISETGCRFVDTAKWLSVSTQLTIKIGRLGPFDAVVAWIDGSVVGLRFNRRLYHAYLEHLREAAPPPGALERRLNIRGEG